LFCRNLIFSVALVIPEKSIEQLAEDEEYVTETVETLAQAIAPEMPWRGGGRTLECLAEHDRIRGYKTRHSLDLPSELVGHDINDIEAIATARTWLVDRQYKLVRDVQKKIRREKFGLSRKIRLTALEFQLQLTQAMSA